MNYFSLFVLLLAASGAAAAQRLVPRLSASSSTEMSADSARGDSLSAPLKRRLLPENLSFVERGVWGEEGLVRTTGILPSLTPQERRHELDIRRTMLETHLYGGIVTFGLMATADYFGQRTIDNRKSRSLFQDHQMFVALTIASYSATGLLAVLAPPPLIRRDETSTITVHKTLAWIHVAGMIVTPFLAKGRHPSSVDAQLRIHQISAYVTTATFAASMIVLTF